MNKVGVVCRAIVFDKKNKKLLLVRNKLANFWYPPGGGLELDEKIIDCTIREVKEETNIDVTLDRLFYVQQFSAAPGEVNVELFWLAYPIGNIKLSKMHIDIGGIVEEGRWFSKDEIQILEVYPQKLKEQFWTDLKTLLLIPNLFIT